MTTKRRTGRGADPLFETEEPLAAPRAAEREPEPKPKKKRDDGPPKVQTSVRLYADTLRAIDIVKLHERLEGNKVSVADVVAEAVQRLMEAKGIPS